jgi:DNA-binding CsgD family transcriptional regulator
MDERAYDLLTPAERTCLRLAGRRLQSKEIAVALDRSPSTVDNHITSALRKLGMSRRAAAGEALLMFEARQESPSQPLIIPAPTMPVDQDGAGAPDASPPPSLVREDRATFEGFDTGEIGSSPEHLTAWLRGLGLVGRLTLVFGTAVLMLLIVLAAPIFAERLGRLGEAIYARR